MDDGMIDEIIDEISLQNIDLSQPFKIKLKNGFEFNGICREIDGDFYIYNRITWNMVFRL